MPYVATDLGRLFVQSYGRGAPVTFWNCLFGDSSVYHPIIHGDAHEDSLLLHHHMVLVEGPSHGRSSPWRYPFSLEQCADAWVDALDASGATEPAVFCGLSWGSMVALRVALQHPDRVRALVLMSTTATTSRRRDLPQLLALAEAVRFFGFPDWLIHRVTPSIVSSKARRDKPNLAHDMLSRNRHIDRVALYQAALSVFARRTNIIDQLWRIRAPTWVVAGRQDKTIPVRAGRTVARAIEGAQMRVIEDVGHMLTLEAPGEIRALLREVLQTVDG